MVRVVLPYFAVAHLLPFLIASWATRSLLPVVVAATLAATFLGGIALGLPATPETPERERHPFIYKAPPKAFAAIGIAYLLFRAPDILAVARALADGSFATYALTLALARYAGADTSSLYSVGTILFFLLCGVAGADAGGGLIQGTRAKAAVGIALLLATFVESVSLAKAGVLLGLTLFATFFLVNRRMALRALSLRSLGLTFAVVGVAATGIFLFSGFFRLSGTDVADGVLQARAANYLLAGHEAFVQWLPQAARTHGEPVGFHTLAFLFKLFGVDVAQGFYDPVETHFGDTNIFLVYRGIIADLGIVGAGVFVVGMGYFIALLDTPQPHAAAFLLGSVALCLVLYPFYSPFIFSTFGVATGLLLLALHPKVVGVAHA